MTETTSHRILIDEQWSLIDLYEFPHAYTHVYGFIHSLTQTDPNAEESVARIYRRYPWRGGYSAVNFYGELYSAMGEGRQPLVKSIQYASPGFIEITAVAAAVVSQLEKIVKAVANSIDYADRVYDRIHKRAMKRKLLSLDVKRREREFEQEEIEFMVNSSKELSGILQFEDLERLKSRTQDDLATLKILLSFYRRTRELSGFHLSGKVRFGGGEPRQIENAEGFRHFSVGRRYSRKEISAQLGGSEINFLPTLNGRVVCGCFTLDHNPEAPHVIIPGTGKTIEYEAETLCSQQNAIPVFIKHRPNEWEYKGDYRVARFSTDPADIAAHHKGSVTPLNEITRVIFLQRA